MAFPTLTAVPWENLALASKHQCVVAIVSAQNVVCEPRMENGSTKFMVYEKLSLENCELSNVIEALQKLRRAG